MSVLHTQRVIVPLDDPLRWFVSRMALFGVVIAVGMVVHVVVDVIRYADVPQSEPVTTEPPSNGVPFPTMKDDLLPNRPPTTEALVAKANDVFVGTPIYNKDGTTKVGFINGIELGAGGEIVSFDISWHEKAPKFQAARVGPSEIDWGRNNQIVTSGEWARVSLEPGERFRAVLKQATGLKPVEVSPASMPPDTAKD